eukprot:gnl/MRDRNA2_/MRDRNA2_86466_c0_seq1.p1 gnl/MRDRNA2_/MRDRNA2_86466_c0~~gnl/MRDRNA2_/MRDRNA2_86466_c0_seq1.p1  ORF type:complete len:657 (+),score=105.70 gnl/MRDRNA2_/MRDRNA2_86466_c0_seq1:289-1971(+)
MGKPETSKLYVEFMGGGACFDRPTCAQSAWGSEVQEGTPGYISNLDLLMTVEVAMDRNCGVVPFGMGNLCNRRNPLKGYSLVYIPYCTGDLHAGNNEYDYEGTMIHHQGAKNTHAVLQWVYEAFPNPEIIVALGGSAGGLGASIWGPVLAEHYSRARVYVLADSTMHVPSGTIVSESWYAGAFGQDCWKLNNKYTIQDNASTINANYADFLSDALHKFNGRLVLAMMTCDEDRAAVEWWHYMMEAYNITYQDSEKDHRMAAMWSMLRQINDTVPAGSFHSYVLPGDCHHMTLEPEFFNLYAEPGKKNVSVWISDVLDASEVNNHVWCDHEGDLHCSWRSYPTTPSPLATSGNDQCTPEDQSELCKMMRSLTAAEQREVEEGVSVMMASAATCLADCCWLQENMGVITRFLMADMNPAALEQAPELVETCSQCTSFSDCAIAKCLAGAAGCLPLRHRGVRRILEMLCMVSESNITDTLAQSLAVDGCCPTACGETSQVMEQQCKGVVDAACDDHNSGLPLSNPTSQTDAPQANAAAKVHFGHLLSILSLALASCIWGLIKY